MKTVRGLLAIMAFSVGSNLAHATQVIKCTDETNPKTGASFWLVLNLTQEKASILEGKAEDDNLGNFIFNDARSVTAADGGPTVVTGEDKTVVDWSKEKSCYKFLGLSYWFRISGDKKMKSDLRRTPNIKVDPSKPNCSFPRVMPPPPLKLSCETYGLRLGE